jgi:hypothetical protein
VGQLSLADIVFVILGKAMNEISPVTATKQNNGAIAARFAAACSGNALFDHPTAQIGIT